MFMVLSSWQNFCNPCILQHDAVNDSQPTFQRHAISWRSVSQKRLKIGTTNVTDRQQCGCYRMPIGNRNKAFQWYHFLWHSVICNPDFYRSRYLTPNTIRYDTVYLTCSKKLTCSQLSPPHGTNRKIGEKKYLKISPDLESDFISVGFAELFSIGFGFDFRFGPIRSLTELMQKSHVIVKIKRVKSAAK